MLTPHCSAASGMVVPSSIAPTTRLRRSSEYGFAIHAGLLPADSLNHIRLAMGIPRFSLLGKRSKAGCGAGEERFGDHLKSAFAPPAGQRLPAECADGAAVSSAQSV